MITRELTRQGPFLLSYIDDFGGVATDKVTTAPHFKKLQDLLALLGLQEATHKAIPHSQVMVWLGLQFDIVAMTVTLPPDKLAEVQDPVHS